MILPTVCLYLTLAGCGMLIALMVVKYDLYRREAWYMVLLTIALGAGGMFLAGEAQEAIIHAFNSRGALISDNALAASAGCTEELAKLGVVLLIALVARRHVDEPIDGIIYGSFAGLGAALEESVHFLGWTQSPTFLPPQEPIRLAGHLIMGGIGAFGIGLLRVKLRAGFWVAPLCLIGAVVLHTSWDIVAFAAADHYRLTNQLAWWHSVLPIVFIVGGMIAYRKLIKVGWRLTRAHLQICDVVTRECPPPP